MDLQPRFTDQQLEQIVEEATIYMCACPAQVAVQLRSLRELYRYQRACESEPDNDGVVHRLIAAATLKVHALMEQCMDDILTLEGWDRATLKMPAGLRHKQLESLARDE